MGSLFSGFSDTGSYLVVLVLLLGLLFLIDSGGPDGFV